ncbi:ABC transporter ATP-binding protein [Microbulbifer sp.]|uniref:ABC transporter ATP-binding protein n=1 Tax=Microbulbifer sp. TaxID=1908541 RepID=UPI003F351926
MLKVSNLCKSYQEQPVVKGVSFSIDAGEVFCLLGSNGAGKTTTVKMLLGLLPATSGEALLGDAPAGDENLLEPTSSSRRHVMYIPENVSLYDDLDAVENIEYLAAVSALHLDRAAITEALVRVGLSAADHRKHLGQFSKGMRQKVVIAFALLKNARLVLMDEPTSGLDPVATRDFIEVVKALRANRCAVMMVTHDLQCAHLLADRIGVMRGGELKAVFPTADIHLEDVERIYFGEQRGPVSGQPALAGV